MTEKKRERAEYMREYAKKNKDRITENQKCWREQNWDRVLEIGRDSKIRNKEAVKARNLIYYLKNKEKCNDATKRWAAANPDKVKLIVHARRTRIGSDRLSKDLIKRLIKLQKGICPCCKRPLGKDFHIDHIVPVSKGGRNIDSNIQLLRSECNRSKGAMDPVEFMQKKGYLL